VAGVIDWKVKAGDTVVAGQLLGEIVNIEDPFAARTPLRTRTAGFIFGMHWYKLAIPGKIMIKVAGDAPLPWRKGNLLTSR
jgi:predicted deacylase